MAAQALRSTGDPEALVYQFSILPETQDDQAWLGKLELK
ncbi:hypothetical protein ACPOL_1213 [Acidisarcina polymorpha]|uniref:Uncharacterized protein n=1 Tax=Acidisarcina polymorpha TaxID=2211140 RepID=A0A2Z5FUM4_9BACT|nr:hypothetical protein ACPOL_1213 [Acidisarcina polymorpha]